MIPDILPLFRARFRIFWWILYFEFSSARDLKLFFPSFAQGFGFFNKLILCPSVHTRFRVLLKNSTSILFRPRFWFFHKLILCPSVRARFKVFFEKWYFYPLPPEVRSWSWLTDTSILFRPRFWIFHKLILCPSVCARFRVLLKNDTSILFCPRFEADLWYFYPPPPEVRSWSWFDLLILLSSFAQDSKLILNNDLFTLLDLHLKASQTWFCSDLTLESQSNL